MKLIDLATISRRHFFFFVDKCNEVYRSGHGLAFYREIIGMHRKYGNLDTLLKNDCHYRYGIMLIPISRLYTFSYVLRFQPEGRASILILFDKTQDLTGHSGSLPPLSWLIHPEVDGVSPLPAILV